VYCGEAQARYMKGLAGSYFIEKLPAFHLPGVIKNAPTGV